MWIRIHLLTALVLCGILLHFAYAQESNSYAVLIGISQFQAGEKWALNFADADANAFQKLITSPRGRAFEQVQLLTNQSAKLQAIKQKVGGLVRKATPRDTVYIFIATHGIPEKNGSQEQAFLPAYDSDPEDLYTTALDLRDLSKWLNDLSSRIFLFGDFCRGGKLGPSLALFGDTLNRKAGIMGLLSSDSGEDSFEGDQWRHGVFTYYLLKGLMGEADRDKDNVVTANEIIRYVTDHVSDETNGKQNPRLFGTFEGMRTTPLSLVDKAGPQDLTRTLLSQPLLQFASMQVALPESAQTTAAFREALQQGRLVEPAGNSAWDLYWRYSRLPIPQSEKDSLKDDLVIALATEGEKIMWAYRRGDAVVPLDAARFEQGAELFGRASEIDPDDPTLRLKAKFLSGRALIERRRYSEGIASLREAITLDPNAAYPYNALGIAYLDQQRWDDAVTNFKAASQRAEKWVYPHYNLARVHTAQKHYRDAEDELKKATVIGADLGLRYSYLYYNLGVLGLFQGRTADAEQQFRRAIEMKPDDALSYHNLGLVFERKRDATQAESSFQKAAAIDKNFIEPRLKLAEIYGNQHRADLEQQMIREAETANTPVSSSLGLLGRFLIQRKKWNEAEQAYVSFLAKGGEPAEGFSALGDVHTSQGRWKDAVEDYRQAIMWTTDPKLLRDLQKKLQTVEKRK